MITLNDKEIKFDKFPNGDIYLKTNLFTIFNGFNYQNIIKENINVIAAELYTSDNIMELLILMNAVKSFGDSSQNILHLLYCPYMQADKYIKEQTNSVSLEVISSIIKICNFDKIYVYGAHSDKIKKYINGCMLMYPIFPTKDITKDEKFYVCSPDSGSARRAESIANILNQKYIQCEKARDLMTGNLISFKLCETYSDIDLTGYDVIIYDDVSVNGGTFSGVAKILKEKGAKNVYLCTTFVINMKKIEHIDKIFTTNLFHSNSFPGYMNQYRIYNFRDLEYFQL
jgi:phosphoribosylpyrophosphate synthetase